VSPRRDVPIVLTMRLEEDPRRAGGAGLYFASVVAVPQR